jgi:predicted O-methyltransferase YrrM
MNTQTANLTIPEATGANRANVLLAQVMTRVPGMMEKNELELLYQLACQSPGTIVELGPAFGRSTAALCLGAQANRVDVVTVDAFASLAQGSQTEEPTLPDDLEPPTKERLRENLDAFGLSATIIDGLSWQAAEQVSGPISLLFHDAEHTADAVERDLSAWAPKLTEDAVIVFHDYEQEVFPGVKEAADQWAERLGWHKGESAGSLQVFRKRPSTANGVTSTRTVTEAVPPSSTASAANPEAMAIAQAYLDAFGANNLAACMQFYADDAVLIFLTKRFVGRQEIEQWHKLRFDAKVEILKVLSITAIGDTVTAEAVVTSKRLKWWKVKLQGRAQIFIDKDKIREVDLRPSRLLT